MWNKPNNKQLATIPGLYETENVDLAKKIIYLRFFIGGATGMWRNSTETIYFLALSILMIQIMLNGDTLP